MRGIEGRPTKTYASLQDVLAAVAKGDCKIGYVISTRGPWLAERHWPGELAFVDAIDAVDEIPICAAVRLADTDLRQAIDQALVAMAESGQLREAFARWNMPFRPAEPAAGIKAKGTE